MNPTRRWFLSRASALGAAMSGLGPALARGATTSARGLRRADRLGPLRPDPAGLLDLPEGFRYVAFSRTGETMDDGLTVPGAHDGMAAFPLGDGPAEDGRVRLVRNHEMAVARSGGPFGPEHALLDRLDPALIYDRGHGRTPCLGGTTTLVFDTASQALERHFLSLAGTGRNCAGGPTPWGSWITCEEFPQRANDYFEKDHGWTFEVPASAEGPVDPRPITEMGRFNHEAIAVDPRSGVVYETEDEMDSLIYRYVPESPGELHGGGRLQALRIHGAPSLDTRNWNRFTQIAEGDPLEVSWVDLDDVEAPQGDLRQRGFLAGAARFARGEGMWYGDGAIFFACTAGGKVGAGQIWRYEPSPEEGARGENRQRGTLTLFVESPHRRLIDACDNVTVAPWGDLVACEDGAGANHLVGVSERGDIYPIARNPTSDENGNTSEFAGATFSPDGSTLFCNIQWPGVTLAITGPWPG